MPWSFQKTSRVWEKTGTLKLSLLFFAETQLCGKMQHFDLWIWSNFFNWAAVQSNVLKNFLTSNYFPILTFWKQMLSTDQICYFGYSLFPKVMTCYSFKGFSSQHTIMQSWLNQSIIWNLKTSILFFKCCSQLQCMQFLLCNGTLHWKYGRI